MDDKTGVASWLRSRGLLPEASGRWSAEAEKTKRERKRLERAAEKLAREERRLRVASAAEVRTLEALGQQATCACRDLRDSPEAREWENLLAVLPDHARRALAAYNVVAFAPAAERARFVLYPAVREEMVQAALLHGVRTADGAIVEVTL